MTCGDGWLDVTPMACAYEVQFRPVSGHYRHRLRKIALAEDAAGRRFRVVDSGGWTPGYPPHYPT